MGTASDRVPAEGCQGLDPDPGAGDLVTQGYPLPVPGGLGDGTGSRAATTRSMGNERNSLATWRTERVSATEEAAALTCQSQLTSAASHIPLPSARLT